MIVGGGARGSTFKPLSLSRLNLTPSPPRWPPGPVPKVVAPASFKGTNYPAGYKTRYTP